MTPIEFDEQNKVLTAPPGMTPDECGNLPVYNDGAQSISAWKPSLRERIGILLGAPVWLSVLAGSTQPPVSVWVSWSLTSKQSRWRVTPPAAHRGVSRAG
jgi:hypothetical protein